MKDPNPSVATDASVQGTGDIPLPERRSDLCRTDPRKIDNGRKNVGVAPEQGWQRYY
jgi:hypothetical protein